MSRYIFILVPILLAIKASAGAESDNNNWMLQYIHRRLRNHVKKVVKSSSDVSANVVGGNLAPPSLHPFQVGILNARVRNDFYAQFCGGTLINSQFVVTAAHCSDFISSASEVSVLVGTKTLSTNGQGRRIKVQAITIHPKWNQDTFDYDVAVWKLRTAVTDVQFASLAINGSDPLPHDLGTVTGWGTMAYDGAEFPTTLRTATVPFVNRSICNSATSYDGQVTTAMFCAGQTGVDSCQGDSGGPLTLHPMNSTLVGVVSWGAGCGWENYPGIYTRVGDPTVYNFIAAATQSQTGPTGPNKKSTTKKKAGSKLTPEEKKAKKEAEKAAKHADKKKAAAPKPLA